MSADGRNGSDLRHPYERPEQVRLKPSDRSSWWVGLSREDFAYVVSARQPQMHNSREALRINPTARD